MSVKNALFGLIDNTGLAELFKRKPLDPTAARKPLLAGIENARKQFTQTPRVLRAPHRWWKVNNGVVALTVKIKGDTFDINGVATNHMPEDRFEEFLTRFRQAVEAGEFDEELANKGNGDAKVLIPKADKRAGIIIVGGKTGRGTISPEAAKARGIKAAESRARRSRLTTPRETDICSSRSHGCPAIACPTGWATSNDARPRDRSLS